ncbi:MAG TPA: Asp-tRNA(Asn)/Glu-tRNA(Gln) amidotransferase subunit GatB [bacterium]|nr:Asp-tRNA(Asn)/Glu-tRNA(Gln) amidotransferase subunit GatB [bacterium]
MDFETVIGMEVHTELSTRSKVFCGCSTAFGAPPNSQTCPVCLGLPGVLPVLNRRAFEFGLKAALALDCTIAERVSLDRKNYYYPDLPKNYQISQKYAQIGREGHLTLSMKDGTTRHVGIWDIHLEEDAGKLIHPEEPQLKGTTLVDLNRAGVPLLEIVSAPDMRTLDEMDCYMHTLRSILRYIDISDCKMQEGSLRFEVNISLRPAGSSEFGGRVEIKNLGSMKAAVKAAAYEEKRQRKVLDKGGTVDQETRLWDEEAGVTRVMRTKEDAEDYRYFPEPDLVEIHVSEDWLSVLREQLPELQDAKRMRFIQQYGLPEYDAAILASDREIADYFESCCRLHGNPKAFSNWIMVDILRVLDEQDITISELPVSPEHLVGMVRLLDEDKISSKLAKVIFSEMLSTGKHAEAIVQEQGLVQVSDSGEIENLVQQVIDANPGPAREFAEGKDKAIAFLMGQLMKLSKGKANPKMATEIFAKKLRS